MSERIEVTKELALEWRALVKSGEETWSSLAKRLGASKGWIRERSRGILGLAPAGYTATIPKQVILEAHKRAMSGETTIAQEAANLGVSKNSMDHMWYRLGLPRLPHRGGGGTRKKMLTVGELKRYHGVVASGGMGIEELAKSIGHCSDLLQNRWRDLGMPNPVRVYRDSKKNSTEGGRK